ncbi:MAG: aldo/keto reductase [Clostridiales bacterium]|jgi:aryl-alcohol dehydrogenase-like predicted oxidoreductase|nr:aldo/keto reductase [Clostridiales bacterium]
MKKRQIANTDLWVSPLALGTMTFGNPVQPDAAAGLVRYALDQGVNLIDTANMYEGYDRVAGSAGGAAESVIGGALRGRREKAVIATKVGMKVGTAPEDDGTSAAAVRKHLQASLKRLETDYVDIYYLHRPDAPELLEDTLRELARCLRDKAIRCYGVSNYSAPQLGGVLNTAKALGVPAPAVCQPRLSLMSPEAASDLIPLCAANGISVIPYKIYEGGLLTGKYQRNAAPPLDSRGSEMPSWLPPLDQGLFDQLERINAEAAQQGMTLARYALNWVLRQPAVVSVIVGAKTRGQLDEAIRAAE